MVATFKIRDDQGRIMIDEQMLIGRYLTNLTIAWNDKSVHTISHEGFLNGIPFFQVNNPNSHYLNCYSSIFGNHSHFYVTFSGTQATIQQRFANGVQDNFVDIQKDIVIHFGVY